MYLSNYHIPVRPENDPTAAAGPCAYRLSEQFYIRDPYILLYGDRYYLYGRSSKEGVGVYVSEDLEHWSEPVQALRTPENFHGSKDFYWAPECHYYKGAFYLFTSVFSDKTGHHSIAVYRASNPLGPFEDITSGSITPADWDAIDGTLYVDEVGQPWMIFVHEWVSMPEGNGSMVAARLSEDFTHFVSEPQHLFYAKDAAWASMGVTDGPYLYRSDRGPLYMIWSNFTKTVPAPDGQYHSSYVVAQAVSESGSILGPWKIDDRLIYHLGMAEDPSWDGGHAMLFADKADALRMVLHGPNGRHADGSQEHAMIFHMEESAFGLRIKE